MTRRAHGTVYLLHFASRYGHAGHYLGWAADVDARLAEHAAGRGARLLAVVRAAGIGWQLARTWRGGRRLERRIKTLGGLARVCPLCRPGTRWGEFRGRFTRVPF